MTSIIALAYCLSVLLICGFATRIGRVLGVMDYPDGGRKAHGRPTPLVGGLALVAPLVAVAALEALRHPGAGSVFAVVAVGGAGFATLGIIDDRRHISPVTRLLVAAALFLTLMWLEPAVVLTALDFGAPMLRLSLYGAAVPFTLLCAAGMQNAVNMADGMNGLVTGLSMFWVAFLMMHAPPELLFLLTLLLVGLAIVFAFNWFGELFLGDAGSYAVGAVIGALMIYVYNSAGGRLPMLTVVLWLLVPVLDCLRLIVERLRAGRSPLSGDRHHFHHYLADRWPGPQALAVYLAVAVGPGLVAAIWPQHTPMLLLAGVILYGEVLRGVRNPPVPATGAAVS